MRNLIVIKKRRTPLYVIEMLMTFLVLSIWLCRKYTWDWIIGGLLYFSFLTLVDILFFRVRFFRYIISILFSLIWATLAYFFATWVTKSAVSPWLLMGTVFISSLLLHKNYFVFEKKAVRVEWEER